MKPITVTYKHTQSSKWKSDSMKLAEAEAMHEQLTERIGVNLHGVTCVRRITNVTIEPKPNDQAVVVVYMDEYWTSDPVTKVYDLPKIAVVETLPVPEEPVKEFTLKSGRSRRRIDL